MAESAEQVGKSDLPRMERAIVVVLDGVGVGQAPDAAAYGDAGADCLANCARAVGGWRCLR